jgi:hypothetical protein
MLSPRRTQITVVDRTLRPPPKSIGCLLPPCLRTFSISVRLALEIMAQYIARTTAGSPPACLHSPAAVCAILIPIHPAPKAVPTGHATLQAHKSHNTAVSNAFDQLEHHLRDRDPRLIVAALVGAALIAFAVWLFVRWRAPSAEEVERRRRELVAAEGRICDGVIVDARTLNGEDSVSPTPEVLVYSYRLAGVTYNCAQDVSRLADRIIGFRLDQPVQVRYDPRNPGNSILVSESWSGLWQK